jgi:YD repeat-containing protein
VYDYEYDDEGNRTAKEHIASGAREEYAWDHRNRLTAVTFKDGSSNVVQTVEQTYDVFNQWIVRSVDADGAGSGSRFAEEAVWSLGRLVRLGLVSAFSATCFLALCKR